MNYCEYDIGKCLLSPPVAFTVVLLATFLLSRLFSRLSFRKKTQNKDEGEPYACGEENYNHAAQPDYSTFFSFAFFFTIAHVTTLIMTTVPMVTIQTFVLALLYITGAVVGLYILMRK